MNKTIILALALILIALGSIYFTTFRKMPEPDREPYKRLGKAIAEETAGLLGGHGRVAILVNQEFGALKIPWLDIEMRALLEALKVKGIAVADVRKLEMRKVGLARPEPFSAALNNRDGIDAFISVVGFPVDPASVGNAGPKCIVAAPYEPGLKRALQEGVIQVAIVPKSVSGPLNGQSPNTFDDGFRVFTRKNAAELP
jgi:hypothetical protein